MAQAGILPSTTRIEEARMRTFMAYLLAYLTNPKG